ncbi:uncharacterized protein EV420DRAFT_1715944 [Desarmillaria tabescens]|uniref:Uncharacterized protein n=1 Tax=Armillaria tabescens TaxID=1929756 RepID=A0AA39JRC4_ARMTA|nr:uncharacterized protein EV420DRAFT_1715944 [Desarmillaria tabescens]KAK0446441.1 hypothetical protein EV420DRAFT_1715944 [Desarmillaria tabescens]
MSWSLVNSVGKHVERDQTRSIQSRHDGLFDYALPYLRASTASDVLVYVGDRYTIASRYVFRRYILPWESLENMTRGGFLIEVHSVSTHSTRFMTWLIVTLLRNSALTVLVPPWHDPGSGKGCCEDCPCDAANAVSPDPEEVMSMAFEDVKMHALLLHHNLSDSDPLPQVAKITTYLSDYVNYIMRSGVLQPPIAAGIINNIGALQDMLTHLGRIFQIFDNFKYLTIPGTAFLSFLLLSFLEIGQEIENPFNYDLNDLVLDVFCLSIQRKLQ